MSRQIDSTDRQIDEFVYELYVLTEDEIMCRVSRGTARAEPGWHLPPVTHVFC